ncbi:MAG TPA: alpha/beta fold hydrolase [Sporichthya sp.]|nr:alpha/beta fold hydrolase [Sporichthya sp.]
MRIRAAAAAFTLALAGLGALADRAPAAASLSWGACTEPVLTDAGAQCATLQVPLDHAKSQGTTISIAISRIKARATGAEYLGPLVANPGGPGVPGLAMSAYLASVLTPEVAGRFDLIGFDPRGVGASGPQLHCDPGYFARPAPDYVPPDPARVIGSERQRLHSAKAYVQACAKNNRGLLAHVGTLDAARDLDRIRAALGSPTLSYFGNSYGTYLGQVYASTFPTRVSRMVLTGVVGPTGVGYGGDVSRPDVARGYERNINAFFAWVAEHSVVYGLGTDTAAVRKHFYADQDALRVAPRGGIGPAEWTELFATAVYGEGTWALLAQGWSGWVAGRTTIFDAAVAGYNGTTADDSKSAYLAFACSDGHWPRNYHRLRADSLRTAPAAPFVTWAFHWQLSALCSLWPVSHAPVVVGAAAPSMLLANATLDAPTPLRDAVATRAAFPRAALIEVVDALGHGQRSLWGNPCVQESVERYLLSGTLPPRAAGPGPDVRCSRQPGPGYQEIALAVAAEFATPLLPLLDLIGPRSG